MSELTEPKPTLISARKLAAAAWRDLRANFWPYVGIVALVTVPVDILMLDSTLAADGGFSAYTTMAALVMNTALIWAVYHYVTSGQRPRFGAAYYQGTAGLVRLVLVNLILLLVLVPSLFGFLIFSFGSSTAEGVSVSAGEQALLAFVWLILSIPTIWLLERYVFAIYGVVGDDLRPMAALRASRQLSLGRYWRVFARLFVFVIFLIAAALVVATPLFLISLVFHQAAVLSLAFQLVAGLVGLPFIHLYMTRLYAELKATS